MIRPMLAALMLAVVSAALAGGTPGEGKGFKHRGFYLHAGWQYNYPFCLRTWSRKDFQGMFRLLKLMGYDTVMYWPVTEAIPAPLSKEDAVALKDVRDIIADAKRTGLQAWLTMCPNVTTPHEIAAKPFAERNPYMRMHMVHLDDSKEREPFLAHRAAMLRIVNNADAYVTIDGDPGGYAGAKPEDLLRVFLADRATIDAHGADPKHQKLIPWVWTGWGDVKLWSEDVMSFSRPEISALKAGMPEPWLLMPGRSHQEGWANGRINVALAEEYGLAERSMVLCYEAVEFEPSPPAAILQFDAIRRILGEEAHLAPKAYGVFANAQQPIMTLPGMYLFARGSADPAYLRKTDEEVLRDLAAFLGGPADLLVPAWQCLSLPLDHLPGIPERLRHAKLTGKAAQCIPGGPSRYLEILAAQASCRIGLLKAIEGPATDDADCAWRLTSAIASLVSWWKLHHFVMDRDPSQGFAWWYVNGGQTAQLREWAARNVRDKTAATDAAAKLLVRDGVLDESEAPGVVRELLR